VTDLVAILSLVVGISALVTDGLLTKIGLQLGCKETNRLFNLLIKKIGERFAHLSITLLGISLLLSLFILYGNSLVLLYFALAFNVPVVLNGITILRRLTLKTSYDYDIGKP
jgi:hypothetical protein